MQFITQDKTNWKYILIVLILAVIVGSGALWFSTKKEQPYQPPEIKKAEKEEDDEKKTCDELYNEMENEFERANYCKQDSDCNSIPVGIPYRLGCQKYINKKVNFYDKLLKMIKEYKDNGCPEITKICSLAGEVKCVDGKCVSGREKLPEDIHQAIFNRFNHDDYYGCRREHMVKEWGRLVDVDYKKIEDVDLNNDGNKEIIIELYHCVYEFYDSFEGGVTGNRLLFIFQKKADNWIEIGAMGGESYSIETKKTNSYYDIVADMDIGWAGCLRAITHYQWDGSYYNETSVESKNVCDI